MIEEYNGTLNPQACPKCTSSNTYYDLTIWHCRDCLSSWKRTQFESWIVEGDEGDDEPDMCLDFEEFEQRTKLHKYR